MLNNKKFTIYVLGTLLVLLSIYSYIVLNHKMLYMNKEYPMWIDVQNKMNYHSATNKFNFLYIGDSRAKAGFIPNKFDTKDINSVNLALGGGTPIEGYYTFKNYISNNETPKYLLISYAPFHISQQDCYWTRTARFNFLEDNDYDDIYNTSLTLNDKSTLGEGEYLNYKIFPGKYLVEFAKGVMGQRWRGNNQTLNYLKISKGHHFFGKTLGSSGFNQEAKQDSFKPSSLINYYLERTIELANKNNIKVFWYTMPFNESSFKITSPLFKKEYNQYIRNLVNVHKITALNTLYFLDNRKFSDPSHLYLGIDEVTEDIKTRFHNKLKNK